MDLNKTAQLEGNGNVEDTSVFEVYSVFDSIPVETFMHICSFLDSKFISDSLQFVCKRFHDILNDETYWKTRVYATYNSKVYPAVPVLDNNFKWQQACLEVEYQKDLWKLKTDKARNKMKHHQWKDVHYATVDAIHLLHNGSVCVSGGRDRSIVVWNLSELKCCTSVLSSDYKPPITVRNKAHNGWIWNLTSAADRLYSCSWDSYVTRWSLQQNIQEDGSYKCEAAVLSVAVDDTILAAGLACSKIVLFDVRGKDAILSYQPHLRSVLALCMDDQHIISTSEDRTVAVWDKRAGKILKDKIRLYSKNESDESLTRAYPLCLSYKNNLLYVGDTAGRLHLLHHDSGTFRYVKRTGSGLTKFNKISCVDHGDGHIIIGMASSVKVLTPTKHPRTLLDVACQAREVTGLAYQDGVLAISGGDSSVEILIPIT